MSEVKQNRHECQHLSAGPRDMRCDDCGGIMRRCCQSALGTEHKHDCKEGSDG